MQKRFIVMVLVAMLAINFLVSACGNNSSLTAQVQGGNRQPATSTATAAPAAPATATPTIDGIPTPDNWVTVDIYSTEGGVAFAPYKLYISSVDIKGILWVNQTDNEITLLNSDIPPSVTPSVIHLAPHGSQKLTLPKNQAGEYLFHIAPSNSVASHGHCTIVRE
jgi:hypothetical protein